MLRNIRGIIATAGVIAASLECFTVVIAIAGYKGYQALAIKVFGLRQGGPAYSQELWITSAMLSITFPLMVLYASYFQFWPMAASSAYIEDSSQNK